MWADSLRAWDHELAVTLRTPLEAQEQAALRRVATLVASGAGAGELFGAVAEEIARVLDVPTIMLARFEPEGVITVLASQHEPQFTPGTRWPLDGPSVVRMILETGKPALIDDYAGLEGTIAAGIRESGIRATVGVPITVDGTIWGLIRVGVRGQEQVPADTADRLGHFTDLLAIALSNAESRDRLRRLADQQAALRRIATAVARGAAIETLCEAVADEVVGVLEVQTASVLRAEPPDWLSVIASRNDPTFPAGSRWPLDGTSAAGTAISSGRAHRVDDYAELPGTIAARTRAAGLSSAMAVPILVDGRAWGVIGVAMTPRQRLALDTEVRVHDFAGLLATAISNTRARERIRRMADEQASQRRVATRVAAGASSQEVRLAVAEEVAALGGGTSELVAALGDLSASAAARARADADLHRIAVEQTGLRRVAELVARAAPPAEIFAAVAEEAARLCELEAVEVVRYERDGSEAVIAATAGTAQHARARLEAPIPVGGLTWGGIVAIATEGHPLPQDVESRLGHFAQLVATAVANLQSHDELRALAAEQAALGRVATLVAEGASAEELFAGLAAEVARVLDVSAARLERYEADGTAAVLARSAEPGWPGGGEEASAEVAVDGRPWGALRVEGSALPPDVEPRLRAFTELVATAVSNAAARSALLASRARIVAAGDEARRRMERDLHDGTQQRLIAIGLDLQRIRAAVPPEPAARLERIEGHLGTVLDDLRELSRGLHPPLLARQGLLPSLRALARRSPIPVELTVELRERPPAPVEIALYYVVAETLANAAAHSQASEIAVRIEADDGAVPFQMGLDGRRGVVNLHVVVADDGVGGATTPAGGGLAGLADRVDALGGRLTVDSPAGGGTRVSLIVPVSPAQA
jgi:signal transduction histidine kinase